MVRITKFISALLVIAFSIALVGCNSNSFDAVPPPIKEFPTPSTFTETEVIIGSLVIEKSFRGNKDGTNSLTLTTDYFGAKDFSVGEVGTVTYNVNDKVYQYRGTVTRVPQANAAGNGLLIVQHEEVPNAVVGARFPGKFSVITHKEDNCVMVAKSAIRLFDDEGNAVVFQINSSGMLVEKSVKVGLYNDQYYQILEGLSVGEKVVLK